MESAFSRISLIDLYDRIIAGLSDDNDIRGLCNLMISKLAFVDPEETTRRLDSIAAAFRATLSTKLKESAVKQELEKQDEANKSVLRVTLLLGEKLKSNLATGGGGGPAAASSSGVGAGGGGGGGGGGGVNQIWATYWEWVNKDFAPQLKSLREENKEAATSGAAA
jgi:cullin-associated NEDD8-dissociated protein 1